MSDVTYTTHLPIIVIETFANTMQAGLLHPLRTSARDILNASEYYTLSEKAVRAEIDAHSYAMSAESMGAGSNIFDQAVNTSANIFTFNSLTGDGLLKVTENDGNIFLDSLQDDSYTAETSAIVVRRYLNGGTNQTISTVAYDAIATTDEMPILNDLVFGDAIGKTLIKCTTPFVSLSSDTQFSVGVDAEPEAIIKKFDAPSTSGLVPFTYGSAMIDKNCIVNSKDDHQLFWSQNWFGDGSLGDVVVSTNTNIASTLNGDMPVMQYNSLLITSGSVLSVSNPCKGLVIYVKGNLTLMPGSKISMTAKGANVNPDTAGVGSNGIEIIRIKNGYPDIGAHSIVNGCGSDFIESEKHQTNIAGNGRRYIIRKYGAKAAYNGPYISDTTAAPKNSNGNSSNQKSGSGQPGTICAPTSGSFLSIGEQGTCFSGGAGGGAVYTSMTTPLSSSGAKYGGNGGAGVGDLGSYDGAGNGGGTLIIIVGGNIVNNGTIEANGSDGENAGNAIAGGGSGGGNILMLYGGALSGTGTVEAVGGSGASSYSAGDGDVQIDNVNPIISFSADSKFKVFRYGSACSAGKMQVLTFFDRIPNASFLFDCSNAYSIARFDNSTEIFTESLARKALAVTASPTVAANDAMYCYGGYTTAIVNNILKFTPSDDIDGASSRSTLIFSLENAASTTDRGTYAFLFGGSAEGYLSNMILTHDLVTDTNIAVTTSFISTDKTHCTAKTDRDLSHSYIFGGESATVVGLTDIDKFTNATYTVAAVSASNPLTLGIANAGSFNDSIASYVYGGMNGTTKQSQVQKFIWSNETVSSPFYLTKTISDGSNMQNNNYVTILNDNLQEKIDLSNSTVSCIYAKSAIHSGMTTANAGCDFSY